MQRPLAGSTPVSKAKANSHFLGEKRLKLDVDNLKSERCAVALQAHQFNDSFKPHGDIVIGDGFLVPSGRPSKQLVTKLNVPKVNLLPRVSEDKDSLSPIQDQRIELRKSMANLSLKKSSSQKCIASLRPFVGSDGDDISIIS